MVPQSTTNNTSSSIMNNSHSHNQPHSSSSTSQSSSIPKTPSSSSKTKKIINTGPLLDQYQDDDDDGLTTDLLHAIRSWNLERPPLLDNSTIGSSTFMTPPMNNNHDCGSTVSGMSIGSSSYQNNNNNNKHNSQVGCGGCDGLLMNTFGPSSTRSSSDSTDSQDGTMGSQSHTSSSYKRINATSSSTNTPTPCRGNYSSRPSGLTARILLMEKDDNADVEMKYDEEEDRKMKGEKKMDGNFEDDHCSGDGNQEEVCHYQQKQQEGEIEIQKLTMNQQVSHELPDRNETIPPSFQEQVHHHHQQQEQQQQIDSTKIVQEISSTLGLNPNTELDKLLPTIKKLVRVVMVHVPNLEQFVTDVCDIVMKNENDDDHTEEKDETESNNRDVLQEGDGFKKVKVHQTHPKSKQQSKQKSLKGRKKRMDEAVHIIKEQWQNKVNSRVTNTANVTKTTSSTARNTSTCRKIDSSSMNNESSSSSLTTITNLKSRKVLQKVNVHNIDARGNNDTIHTTKKIHTIGNENNNVESSFRNAVMGKLKRFHHDDIVNKQAASSSSTLSLSSSPPPQLTTMKASYQHDEEQALDIIDNLIDFELKYRKVKGMGYGSDNSLSQSPPQSQSLLRDLFDTDPTTLRQLVLHFAYLFSVKQDEIMAKMNDVYVFSHEASAMIEKIKKILGLSSNCSSYSVERKIMEMVNGQSQNKNSSLLNNYQQQHQQRNQQVRFKKVVEEFS